MAWQLFRRLKAAGAVSGPRTVASAARSAQNGGEEALGGRKLSPRAVDAEGHAHYDVDEYVDEYDDNEEYDEEGEPPSFSPVRLQRMNLSDDGRLSVVGESYYQRALALVADGRTIGESFDDHLPVTALLVPEPENPYDSNAVRVDVLVGHESLKVGYLARANAELYQPHLLEIRQRGYLGECPARVTGGGPERYYGIYLHVAEPLSLFAPPPVGSAASFARVLDREIVLKPERHCTVTKEHAHQDVLRRHAPRKSSSSAPTMFTLDLCIATSGKHRGQEVVEVRLDGSRVGELTMAMTLRYIELIRVIHDRNSVATCYGYIAGTEDQGYQVELHMPRDPSRPRSSAGTPTEPK